ncbi:MAG: tyrosine-type recombinase/integrase [Deltaproteobacteria bacterium]|nr:tyrosine-type recombinase/integrase [Deltaproteobacteria bacterium]
MRPFRSFLAGEMEAYAQYRKSLGYKTMPAYSYLLTFDDYLVKADADWHSFTPSFFLEMRASLKIEARSINNIFCSIRGLFHFLAARGYLDHNPLRDIPPLKENAIVPFVFSPDQIDELLKMVSKNIRTTNGCFLTDLAVYMVVLVMARCGMRISEPIKLLRCNYCGDDATLFVEETKFGKDRIIPIPRDVVTEIENYLAVRQSLRPNDDNPYLFAGRKKRCLSATLVRATFDNAVMEIGIKRTRKVLGNVNFNRPTPHSLRHSFAVNTLNRIKKSGGSAQNALPVLAAYLGHRDYICTSVYLRVSDAMSRKNLVDFSLWQKANE